MELELKKAIIDFMIENQDHFQLVNETNNHFRQYIYTPEGNFCIGGKKVNEFISKVYEIIKC